MKLYLVSALLLDPRCFTDKLISYKDLSGLGKKSGCEGFTIAISLAGIIKEELWVGVALNLSRPVELIVESKIYCRVERQRYAFKEIFGGL